MLGFVRRLPLEGMGATGPWGMDGTVSVSTIIAVCANSGRALLPLSLLEVLDCLEVRVGGAPPVLGCRLSALMLPLSLPLSAGVRPDFGLAKAPDEGSMVGICESLTDWRWLSSFSIAAPSGLASWTVSSAVLLVLAGVLAPGARWLSSASLSGWEGSV